MKILSLFLILILSLFNSYNCDSQTVNFEKYESIQSKGAIPDGVIRTLSLANQEEINRLVVSEQKRTAKQKTSFLMKNDFEILQMIRDGNLIFGDTITQYIYKVGGELLKNKPELLKELTFFTSKKSSFNAFTSTNGFIFFNVGLIANIQCEAEMAFVMAHEIAHYIKQHPLEDHIENIKIIRGKSAYKFRTTNSQKLDLMGKRSRQSEFEADSLAIMLFLESGYSADFIDKSMEHLHYSSIPLYNKAFDKAFFNSQDLVIPSCYFLDSCSKLSPIEDVFDANYSHPNVFKRRNHATKILAKSTPHPGKEFISSKEEFEYIRKVAKFELIHLKVHNKEYGDVIYDAYALLQEYPDNCYLQLAIAEALYGLTKYKNDDKYFYVAEPFEKIEGESQQVHFFLKQLNRKQLNTLAVNYIHELKNKHPEIKILDDLETDLINELVLLNNIDVEKLKSFVPIPFNLNSNVARKDQQKQTEAFYMACLKSDLNSDKSFADKFINASKNKEIESKKQQISLAEKAEREQEQMEQLRKTGLNKNFDRLIIIDPYIEIDPENITSEYAKYESKKSMLDNCVTNAATSINHVLISSQEVKVKNDINLYNQLSTYREFLKENMSHNLDIFYPVGSTYYNNSSSNERNLLCYIGLFKEEYNDHYYIQYMDMQTGETIYWNEGKFTEGNYERLKKQLAQDFQVLTK